MHNKFSFESLKKIIPDTRIRHRYIDRIAYGADAGFYYMMPEAIVHPNTEDEIISLFKYSHDHKIPITFRTAGTSLCGQAITDGILVDLSQFWNKIAIENNGSQVRVQPGITGGMVNARLKKYFRKIGPDPASINAAMMGGIISNNSSGMCCGVDLNSYHTTKFIRFILPNGKIYTTENETDYSRFIQESSDIATELISLRNQIISNRELYDRIRHKYLTKNTVGYSLNAFIDFEHPLDILAHLMIGAEGTLAFISEAVMQTVPDPPYRSTAILYFATIRDACDAIIPLKEGKSMMVELMDRASLTAIENMEGIPSFVKDLPESACALLIEFQEESKALIEERLQNFKLYASTFNLLYPPNFTNEPKEQEQLWKIRKGLFPAVGAIRASGTTMLLEDLTFPLHLLGDAIKDLQYLFKKYQYDQAIILGHAKDGNLHFAFPQSLETTLEIERYDHFMKEVVELVVKKYDGSLKGEHGTGRNMAPFVETEWGGELYDIMKKLKSVIDPEVLLNPGVIINDDKNAHLQYLKKMPSVESEVDKCIECGFCESKCPSKDLTLSPRKRIIVRRVLQQLKSSGKKTEYKQLLSEYQYSGLDTCAVDGLCAIACPVDINTGDLVKRLRKENHSPLSNYIAFIIAKNFSIFESLIRTSIGFGFTLNSIFGNGFMQKLTATLNAWIKGFPIWSNKISYPPEIVSKLKSAFQPDTKSTDVIYFPSCISRIMGDYEGKEKNIMQTFASLSDKAGIKIKVLTSAQGTCCSQIFSSKGYSKAQKYTAENIIEKLWIESNQGQIPIVIDVSSCAYTLHQLRPVLNGQLQQKFDTLKIMDTVDFLHDWIIKRTSPSTKKENVVLHPVCSLQKMKTDYKLINIANHFSNNVTIPESAGCCGMAGDRGFLVPELTASATKNEAAELHERAFDGYYSSTKTCEMALSEATQQNYESILYLADECL
ncbi:MAG: FAD-binding and (Fe-S)-binding domain-containing protein [Chitinophagaceae bacterium]